MRLGSSGSGAAMIPLIQEHHEFEVAAEGPALVGITSTIASWLAAMPARDGVLTVFLRHATGSLTIQDTATGNVRADLLAALNRLDPNCSAYGQNDGGAGNLPAAMRAMLTSVSLTIPVIDGSLAVGPSQDVYLIEHRKRSTPRAVLLHYVGSRG
jgi:secondary thiamine-phosphate synthase enzyme